MLPEPLLPHAVSSNRWPAVPHVRGQLITRPAAALRLLRLPDFGLRHCFLELLAATPYLYVGKSAASLPATSASAAAEAAADRASSNCSYGVVGDTAKPPSFRICFNVSCKGTMTSSKSINTTTSSRMWI
ncbi:hypothetical protein Vretimale_8518 [Volvox reticuliferus]|uniref:Uncharacterized protein n=1 Tax=Volvox reticuliferus TaxID=1737510 RepID=A0A8J4GBT2_9CHLO|nr:hypothetical protein Vretimale_8518 [Volvox reticuliferus]